MTNQNTIGSTIRRLRTERGLHRDDFAKRIGIEGGHLYRLEEGFHSPSAKIITKMCLEFQVSADVILGIKN